MKYLTLIKNVLYVNEIPERIIQQNRARTGMEFKINWEWDNLRCRMHLKWCNGAYLWLFPSIVGGPFYL